MKKSSMVLAVVVATFVGVTTFTYVFNDRTAPTQEDDIVFKVEKVEISKVTNETKSTSPTPKPYKVKRLNLANDNVISLMQEITPESVDATIRLIEEYNAKNNKPIYIILDSPGGSVVDGARLISVIEASKNPVTSICVNLCASMAFMILEHSHVRAALDRATLMGHPASVGVMYQGELDKLVSRFTYLKRYVDKMDIKIAKRAGMSYEQFKSKTTSELWIDSEDSLNDGLLDQIVSLTLPKPFSFTSSNDRLRKIIEMK